MKAAIYPLHTSCWTLVTLQLIAIKVIVMSDAIQSNSNRRCFLRLFLIRHGETESNVNKIVVGQSESIEQPLTVKGIEQARALGEVLGKAKHNFWRIYSSDLQRAQHTTRLIVRNDGRVPFQLDLRIDQHRDKRLREVSRGAREGLPKGLTDEQAYSERVRLGIKTTISPAEETYEAWIRVAEWLEEVMHDAADDNFWAENSHSNYNQTRNVLVISHSGLLRIFLERLVGIQRLQHHPSARFEEHSGVRQLSIPNTSVTILNIDVHSLLSQTTNEERTSWAASDAVHVEQLTNTDHYSRMQLPRSAIPPNTLP